MAKKPNSVSVAQRYRTEIAEVLSDDLEQFNGRTGNISAWVDLNGNPEDRMAVIFKAQSRGRFAANLSLQFRGTFVPAALHQELSKLGLHTSYGPDVLKIRDARADHLPAITQAIAQSFVGAVERQTDKSIRLYQPSEEPENAETRFPLLQIA